MEEVVETTQETAKEVNALVEYLQSSIPDLIGFGMKVLLAILFFLIGRVLIKWVRGLAKKTLEHSSADKGVQQFIDSLLRFGLYAVLIFSVATKFGVDAASVAAIIASAGVAIGLALQDSLGNFVGGVLILLLKPFVVGDYIVEDNNHNEGTVKEIQLFYTKLATVDNRLIVIPNGMLTSNSLTNVTHMEERQLDLKIPISYDADIREAKDLLEELLLAESRILKDKEQNIFVHELGEDGVILGVRAWTKMDEYWKVRWKLLEDIKLCFDAAKIEIPYRHMTLQIKENKRENA